MILKLSSNELFDSAAWWTGKEAATTRTTAKQRRLAIGERERERETLLLFFEWKIWEAEIELLSLIDDKKIRK